MDLLSQQNPYHAPEHLSRQRKFVSKEDRQLTFVGAFLACVPIATLLLGIVAMSAGAPSPHPLLALLALAACGFCTLAAIFVCPIAAWKCPNWLGLGSLLVVALDVALAVLLGVS